jgi:hypothetical protein
MKKLELSNEILTSFDSKFAIHIKGELYAEDLTYEEMGDNLMYLAEEFYVSGEPDPKDIEVKIIGDQNGKTSITD